MSADNSQGPRWLPSLGLLILIIHLIFVTVQPDRMMMDPGSGWHMKMGQLILVNGGLNQYDLLSYTVPDREWINYQWVFQVTMGLAQLLGGLSLAQAVCAVVFALVPTLLCFRMLREGGNVLLSMMIALMAYFILLMHALARPHCFTYLYLVILAWALYWAYEKCLSWSEDRKTSYWKVSFQKLFGIPLLIILWTNTHGGFAVGLVLIGIYFASSVMEWVFSWGTDQFKPFGRRAVIFTSLFVVCILASLVNPYGYGLHMHILSYLGYDVLKINMEFQPPNFGGPSLNIRLYELILIGLILGLGRCQKRVSWPEIIAVAFFLHFALGTVRHVLVHVILLLPLLSRVATDMAYERLPWWRAHSEKFTKAQSDMQAWWPGLTLIVVTLLLVSAVPRLTPLRQNFDGLRLSHGAIEWIDANPEKVRRMFNTDDLGGALIYKYGPELKVYTDDRNDLYGPQFIDEMYLPVFTGSPDWRKPLDHYEVTSAIVSRKAAVVFVLRDAPDWEIAYEDGSVLIFLKVNADVEIE